MLRYRDLEVWRRSHALVLRVYALTGSFPGEERFGYYARFLNVSEASLSETDYLLLCARDLGYLRDEDYVPVAEEAEEICRMLYAFRRRLELDR